MKSLIKPGLLLALLWLVGCNQSSKTTNGIDSAVDQQTVSGQSVSKDLALKTMNVNGVNLHYVEKGEGTPVVFVHGGLGDYRAWISQIETFTITSGRFPFSIIYEKFNCTIS